jgi:NodT family efflux transporter outer membrane factor (OMF) lipoprotein
MPDPFRPLRSPLAAASAAVLLGGCVVGPTYKGPPAVAPAAAASGAFHRAGDASPAQPAARWWAALGDPQLDGLIDQALAASPDLEAAQARLRQSRAGLKQSRANLMPTTQASALYLHTQNLTAMLGGPSGGGLNLYDTGFDATWEIDLFGGERRAVEGASAQAQALQADLEDAQVTLEAEVAQAYVSLRDLQQRLANARSTAELETQMLALAKVRRAGGTASDLDVEQLQNQLETTRANAIPLQAQITDQLDRLAVLTGREPGALDAELSEPAAVPAPPPSVAVGDPAALLRRRPDIRAAERRLAQQNALIGQRTADLFPKVQLLGSIGFASTDLGQLLSSNSFTPLAGPVLQWSPFDFGRTRARISQAEAARDEARANYRKTVLGALEDAETSLSRYGRQRESVVSLERVAATADRTSELTALRVKGGTATTLDQLDAERRRVDALDGLTEAKAELTQDYISLQKSLGLGWSLQKAESSTASPRLGCASPKFRPAR